LPEVKDHGIVFSTVERDLAAAQRVIRDLDAIGLPMRQVTDVLEQEGVTTFKTAFEDILQRLDEKRLALAREQAAQGNRALHVPRVARDIRQKLPEPITRLAAKSLRG